ncbi:hypothetical protein FRC17_006535, partial [Serendipita sp. 399]
MPPVPQKLSPPPTGDHLVVSSPAEHVLLLCLNRTRALNSMTPEIQDDIEKVLDWAEREPDVWVIIITGSGRAFCAGHDLKGWLNRPQNQHHLHEHGFAGISSRRSLTKPLIAAVNGLAFGGGTELILNCDLVVASESARFALPEVSRGVVAAQGGIPRLANAAGHQLASEMLLLGRPISAQDAYQRFNILGAKLFSVNAVVPSNKLMSTALEWATIITSNSPDAVQSTKKALLLAKESGMWEGSKRHFESPEHKQAMTGDNIKEGLTAFSRFHIYEGYTAQQVTFPIRLFSRMGCKSIILTNAAGSLNPAIGVGTIMVIQDHLSLPSLTGLNPLFGPTFTPSTPRFIPLSNAYSRQLRKLVFHAAAKLKLSFDALAEGVYCWVTGPTFETAAEGNFLRLAGGDVVGASTVPEVMVAREEGMQVLAMSLVTNMVVMSSGDQKVRAEVERELNGLDHEAHGATSVVSHDEVLAMGLAKAELVKALVVEI